jgi:hypothetical protein
VTDLNGVETKDELLAAVQQAGFAVTDTQLARWHRVGLLPKPQVQSLGRGKGTRSLYPPLSAARLIRIAEVHEQERRLRPAAWRIWWEDGGTLSAPAREHLIGVARDLDRQRALVIEAFEGDAAGDPRAVAEMDELFRSMERDRLPQPLGEARRRVGPARFSIVGRIVLELIANRFDGFQTDPETGEPEGALLEKSWGLERGRTDRLATAEPWLQGDLGPDMVTLARLIASKPLVRFAESTADEELDLARHEFTQFVVTMTTAARMLQGLFGSDAFGYGMLVRLFDIKSTRGQATALLGWMALRQDEGLREGMAQLAGLRAQAQATERLAEITQQMREAVPALSDLLSPERLAAAQLDTAEDARLRTEIRATANAHRDEVGTFLQRYPDLEQLQELALGSDPRSSNEAAR